MIGEIDVCGILVPPLLVWLVLALPLAALVRRLSRRAGLYAHVWHPPLFDLAVLVLLVAAVSAAARHFW